MFAFMVRPVFGQQGCKNFVWLHQENNQKATPRNDLCENLSYDPNQFLRSGPYEIVGFIKPSLQRLTPARCLAWYATRCLLGVICTERTRRELATGPCLSTTLLLRYLSASAEPGKKGTPV